MIKIFIKFMEDNAISNFIIVILLVFLIFNSPVSGGGVMFDAGGVDAGGGGDQEYGYTTIGSSQDTLNLQRRIETTIPAGGDTIRYGYFYGSEPLNLGTTTIQISVLSSPGGVLQGTCSASSATLTDVVGWWEVTFTPFFLAEGTYYLQFHKNTESAILYTYDIVGANSAYDTGIVACGTLLTTASTRKANITIANHNAH